MLTSHLKAIEKTILANSQIAANSGHPNHKGTPREQFIRDFLSNHISGKLAVGTGEIIDCDSAPSESRPQFDVIVYDPELPRLKIGGDIHSYLAESVLATIEVKSRLDKAGLLQAVKSAAYAKVRRRNLYFPVVQLGRKMIAPPIQSYVVAYDSTATLSTIHNWLHEIHEELDIHEPTLPLKHEERLWIPSPSIDAIIILGRGFLHFDNSPISFITQQTREASPDLKWVWAEVSEGALVFFFGHLSQRFTDYFGAVVDLLPYFKSFELSHDALHTCCRKASQDAAQNPPG